MNSVSSLVFCPPLPGKPDYRVAKPDGTDIRPRIFQKGDDSNTCWYTVFNPIRERYRAPNTKDWEGRKIEKAISRLRKEFVKLDETVPIFSELEKMEQHLTPFTKKTIISEGNQRILQEMDNLYKKTYQDTKNLFSNCATIFLEQDRFENFYEFLKHYPMYKSEELAAAFLKRMGVIPEEVLAKSASSSAQLSSMISQWQTARSKELAAPQQVIMLLTVAGLYGMERSSWDPRKPFRDLRDELREYGPLVVSGNFGRQFYTADPDVKGAIQGHKVYGWKKGEHLDEKKAYCHMALLIGAEKNGSQELVYFYDPKDPSDPKHPKGRPAYVMAYSRLQASISSIANFYAYRGPQQMQTSASAESKQDSTT